MARAQRRSIGDKDIQTRVPAHNQVDGSGDGCRPLQVHAQRLGRTTGGSDFSGDRLQRRLVAGGQYAMRAGTAVGFGDGKADAAIGAGDQRDASF